MNLSQLPNILKSRLITPYRLQRRYEKVLNKNQELKNTKTGKRCFIIGNGPSIKNQDLVNLNTEETFVVNSFWHHPQYKEINPKYYLVVDTENFPQEEKQENAWSKDMIERNSAMQLCQTKLFFNIIGKKFIEKNQLYPHNEIYYLAFHDFFRENMKFNIEITKILPNVKNVIIAGLIVAVYMGFEEIYLLGCEHDFLAYPSKRHYEGFKHFYKTKDYNLKNKKEVDYFTLATHSYERHIDNVKVLFRNYRLLAKKLSKINPNVKIYNATPDSFLDVFPYVNFNDIKRLCCMNKS